MHATAYDSDGSGKIEVLSPFDGSRLGAVPDVSAQGAMDAIARAVRGFKISRALARHQRASFLERAAWLLEEDADSFARLISRESGKVLRASRKEVHRCANTLRLSAEEAKRLGGEVVPFDSVPGSERRVGYFQREPIGVVVAITPFNDPLNLVAHKLGPAVAAGNAVVLKLSELAPLSGLRLVELLEKTGLPSEIITVVTGKGSVVGPALVSAPEVRLVTFTGGFQTAHAIKKSMGLARISMDLGGNGAVIVLDDCDLERAVAETTSGAFWASGQNCVGVQRVFVQKRVFVRFVEMMTKRTRELVVGNPLDERTDIGPMISVQAASRAEGWIKDAVAAGAKLVHGGERSGTLLQPTILTHVPETAYLSCEEAFAPLVCINPIESLDEGITRANAPAYGIHAAIFTSNLNAALSAADALEAGGVMINDSTDYRLDAMPFGGVKAGSLGREGVRFAIEEMTQTKVVCFNR